VRGNNAGSTPYKLPEKILTAIEAGSPRYFRVIFCVKQRYFPRQNDRAQVKSKRIGQLVPFKSGEGGAHRPSAGSWTESKMRAVLPSFEKMVQRDDHLRDDTRYRIVSGRFQAG
jgi:hypothetical protein